MTQQEFQTRYKYNPSTDCIGEGGFGKVYKAYDTHLDKWVAIKVAEVKTGLEQVRLKKEVEIVSKLPTHPNIANYEACYTFSSFTGEYDFAVLQYYEEGNLQQLIDSGKLNQTQKEALLRQILEGIGFLHNQDIIHRDLKPQNILIAKRNDEYIPKITDFGISKKLDINKSSVFTNSLAGAGTMAYASPEQLLGKTIKKNTDLWSFGVIAFQLLTGKLPFNTGKETITSEAGRLELFKQITNGVVGDNLNSISDTWKSLIISCLVVDNNLRTQNASKLWNIPESKLEFVTDVSKSIITHEIKTENYRTRVENRNTTIIENIEQSKSKNNQSDNSSNLKIIISILAIFILIIVIFKYYNQSPDNLNDDLQSVIADTVAVDSTAIFKSNSTNNDTDESKKEFQNDKEIVYSSMTDIDGNVYKTVKIGNQIWMAENYRFKSEQSFCYENDETNHNIIGRIYHWDDAKSLAPKGWHLPSKNDFKILLLNSNQLKLLNLNNGIGYLDPFHINDTPGWYNELSYWSSTPLGEEVAWCLIYRDDEYKLFWSNAYRKLQHLIGDSYNRSFMPVRFVKD